MIGKDGSFVSGIYVLCCITPGPAPEHMLKESVEGRKNRRGFRSFLNQHCLHVCCPPHKSSTLAHHFSIKFTHCLARLVSFIFHLHSIIRVFPLKPGWCGVVIKQCLHPRPHKLHCFLKPVDNRWVSHLPFMEEPLIPDIT